MNYTVDMTKGGEWGHIIRFALPLLFGNIFQQLYNIVDSVIVGKHLGSQSLAAVGATGSITFLFYTLCIGLGVGAGILISQAFGAKDGGRVKRLISASAWAMGIIGVMLSVISVCAAPFLLRLLDTPDSIFPQSVSYMRIACAGTIAVAMYNWINAVMRSLGDSKTPLIFLIIASIINVILDVVFVIFLEMGVNGAALATVTAQGISAAGSIIFALLKNPLFKLKLSEWKFDIDTVKRCMQAGIPIALQNAMVSVSMIFLQRTANSFGDTVIAAYTATMRIEQLIQQPFSSLNAAVSAFVGQNIGAGKQERAVNGYKVSVKAGMIFAFAAMAVFLIFSRNIIGVFVDEKSVIDTGAFALRISCLFYSFLGMIHITRGFLNGAGDINYAMINGFAEVAGRIGFALILVHIPAVGFMAVWGTTCLTWTITGIMSVMRYKQGVWKNKYKTG